MRAFLDMGGYAAYVWPSYAVTLAVVALNIVSARRALARARAEARRRLAMREEAR
ncbi:MAG: heme exporter protein CcmD [Gammaproteobacteria bacterium]|nr:heme exporter protein CcmD [Gammaproteobacteria bacterium]